MQSPGLSKTLRMGGVKILRDNSQDRFSISDRNSSERKSTKHSKTGLSATLRRKKSKLGSQSNQREQNKPIPIPVSEKEAKEKADHDQFLTSIKQLRKEVEERAVQRRKREQLMKYLKSNR